jgi:hypothetical protein
VALHVHITGTILHGIVQGRIDQTDDRAAGIVEGPQHQRLTVPGAVGIVTELELVKGAQRLFVATEQCEDVIAVGTLRSHRAVQQEVCPGEQHRFFSAGADQLDVVTGIEQEAPACTHLAEMPVEQLRHARAQRGTVEWPTQRCGHPTAPARSKIGM